MSITVHPLERSGPPAVWGQCETGRSAALLLLWSAQGQDQGQGQEVHSPAPVLP